MGTIRLAVCTKKPEFPVTVDVERVVRHRGVFSLNNYFVIGKATVNNPTIHYRLYLCPMAYFDTWRPQNARQLAIDGMVQWADGTLSPERMKVISCIDVSMIREVLSYAFRQPFANEHLEDFHQAQVELPFLRHLNPVFTIASLINPGQATR